MMTTAMIVPVRAGVDMRLLRAAVFSAICVALSAAGHLLASGTGMPLWAPLAGWVGVMCFAAPLAGRERSLPGIAVALLGGELGLHLLFSVGQWCGSSASPSRNVNSGAVMALASQLLCKGSLPRLTPESAARIIRQTNIAMPHMPGMTPSTGTSGAHTMAMSLPGTCSVSMLAVHVAAAVVLGWVLRRGESAVWRMIGLSAQTAAQIAALLALTAVLASVRTLALLAGMFDRRLSAIRALRADDETGQPESVKLQHTVVRRGPPTVTLAA
ncbi:MAG: hypothetical protein JO362_01300 [Streptomycetaceae bacterium]|nr:hypothetical protein [Streptomycetaceae bacterium]